MTTAPFCRSATVSDLPSDPFMVKKPARPTVHGRISTSSVNCSRDFQHGVTFRPKRNLSAFHVDSLPQTPGDGTDALSALPPCRLPHFHETMLHFFRALETLWEDVTRAKVLDCLLPHVLFLFPAFSVDKSNVLVILHLLKPGTPLALNLFCNPSPGHLLSPMMPALLSRFVCFMKIQKKIELRAFLCRDYVICYDGWLMSEDRDISTFC